MRELKEAAVLPGGMVRVRLLLECGCEVEREIDARRIVQLENGRRLAAGKYPCPAGHPPGAR